MPAVFFNLIFTFVFLIESFSVLVEVFFIMKLEKKRNGIAS